MNAKSQVSVSSRYLRFTSMLLEERPFSVGSDSAPNILNGQDHIPASLTFSSSLSLGMIAGHYSGMIHASWRYCALEGEAWIQQGDVID